MKTRENLIRERVELFRSGLENPAEILSPSLRDIQEEIEIGKLSCHREESFEESFLAEAFEGFGQGD